MTDQTYTCKKCGANILLYPLVDNKERLCCGQCCTPVRTKKKEKKS